MRTKVTLWIIIFCIGLGIGWFIPKSQTPSKFKVVRETNSDYKFSNPLLFVETSEDTLDPEYKSLKQSINNYINTVVSNKKASLVSVYVRNLNSSNWIGINTDKKFSPASMLKVATLIYALKHAEIDTGFLSKNVTIENSPEPAGTQDFYPPKDPIRIGNTYTVEELLSHMIIDSDNVAALALQKIVGPDEIQKVYNDLQVPMPTDESDSMTTQQYSHFFRVLYGGTYLDHYISEQALDLLSQTTFNDGLIAGLPSKTVVSHKFGERTIKNETVAGTSTTTVSAQTELHDCGIVYYPNNPYLICIMTKGNDFPTLASVLKDISKIVWDKSSSLN